MVCRIEPASGSIRPRASLFIKQVSALSDDPYTIDITGIRRAFPPGAEAPPLLLDFAAWLAGRQWGSAGCFNLIGDFADRAPIFDGSPLRDKFALFARLPEGSVVGAWYGAGQKDAPIVVLSSEGQHQIVAASFENLLARIALRRFEEEDTCTDFTPDEDVEDATGELADWLGRRLGIRNLEKLARPPAGLPDFRRWIERWCNDREQFWANQPSMVELADHLVAHRPPRVNSWDRTHFEVAIAGHQYQMRVLRRGRQPVEEAPAIEPLLRGLRDDMWRARAELGLWYSMSLTLAADGRILPCFDYETRPVIGESVAELAEARADLARAPRPEQWVPSWLATS
jgi:hypothetical protein